MVNMYANKIIRGDMTIDEVPEHLQEDVQARVDEKMLETYSV